MLVSTCKEGETNRHWQRHHGDHRERAGRAPREVDVHREEVWRRA